MVRKLTPLCLRNNSRNPLFAESFRMGNIIFGYFVLSSTTGILIYVHVTNVTEDHKLQFGKSRLVVIFCILFCVKKKIFKEMYQMFQCLHASLSSIVSTCNHFWHDGHTIYTRNSSTLGVQSNITEDDTSQWKLWIGVYLKCIHEQGEYFLLNSKNIRNRCINLLLYQLSIATYPSGAVEFTPISCVELVFFCAVFCIYHCVSFGRCFVCTLTCLCISRHRWEL